MAFIALKWFAGMVPRLGNQHLKPPHATEAENCNLYSGELRPLNRPALAHQFCEPGDTCFLSPKPDDPSIPPTPPPEPPACVAVVIVTQPTAGDLSLVEGGTPLTLTVIVNTDATVPVQYQWLQDNQALPGEVGPVFDTVLQPSDSFTSFTVFVQNPCGEQISLPVVVGEVIDQPFCKLYGCDAYEQALIASGADAIWVLDDDSFPQDVPVNPIRTSYDLLPSRSMVISTASLLPGSCNALTALSNNNSVAEATAFGYPIDNSARFTYSMLVGNGSLYGLDGLFVNLQITGGGNGIGLAYIGNTLYIFLPNNTNATYAGFKLGTPHVVTLSFDNDTKSFDLYRNHELYAQGTYSTSINIAHNNPDLSYMQGSGAMNYASYWNYPIDAAENALLLDGWERNEVAYTDPNPNCRMPA